jgi:hypothetical protein
LLLDGKGSPDWEIFSYKYVSELIVQKPVIVDHVLRTISANDNNNNINGQGWFVDLLRVLFEKGWLVDKICCRK